MKYKMIMTMAIALTAVVVASVGLAVATDAPWDRSRDRARDGIQQQDRDQVSRPAEAGPEAAMTAMAATSDEPVQLRSQEQSGTPARSRAASGTPAARGAVGLIRAQERASEQAQAALARVRERVEAKKAEQNAGEQAQVRTRTGAEVTPPVANKPDDPGAGCPNPVADCAAEAEQERDHVREGEGGSGNGPGGP